MGDKALHPTLKKLLLSPMAVSALGCAVAVAEGGLCWLGGKERSQAGHSNAVLCLGSPDARSTNPDEAT